MEIICTQYKFDENLDLLDLDFTYLGQLQQTIFEKLHIFHSAIDQKPNKNCKSKLSFSSISGENNELFFVVNNNLFSFSVLVDITNKEQLLIAEALYKLTMFYKDLSTNKQLLDNIFNNLNLFYAEQKTPKRFKEIKKFCITTIKQAKDGLVQEANLNKNGTIEVIPKKNYSKEEIDDMRNLYYTTPTKIIYDKCVTICKNSYEVVNLLKDEKV